jgi:hypothetical protein
MKKVRYIVGKVDEPLDLDPDEKVIFAGDCTCWQGTINGKNVNIESSYKSPKEVDEQNTQSNDMLLKTWKTLWACFKQKNSRHIHAKGCPVSVGDHVHYLSSIGKIKNVNFDPRMLIALNIAYWKMRTNRLLNRFLGK